ncbi:MAG: hypothetical protein LBW85_05850 [Deltaproteobacteria bacterium]|nr:hypothetical protein [Deltaproteobacteria bacterium]
MTIRIWGWATTFPEEFKAAGTDDLKEQGDIIHRFFAEDWMGKAYKKGFCMVFCEGYFWGSYFEVERETRDKAAKMLLARNMPVEAIAEPVGLAKEEIEALK